MYTCTARNPRFARVVSAEINQASYVRKQNKFHSIEIALALVLSRASVCCVFVNRQHLSIKRICIPSSLRANAGSGGGGGIIFPIRYKYTGRVFGRNRK